jgi:selenide,water dikinase
MLASNREAAACALAHGVRCATDVTGFGLLGHLHELAAASGLAARVDPAGIGALPGVLELAAAGHLVAATHPVQTAQHVVDFVDRHT